MYVCTAPCAYEKCAISNVIVQIMLIDRKARDTTRAFNGVTL